MKGRSMKTRTMLVMLGWALGWPAGAVTLDELAARLEKLEAKVAAYEERYGPLDGPQSSLPETMRGPVRPSQYSSPAKGGMGSGSSFADTDRSIDESFGVGGGGGGGGAGNWWERTTLGGYGEMHLNLGDVEEIDFHRWVLFLNHRFNDRIKLYSELELEHSLAGEGKAGEVELEQAYIEFALDHNLYAKAGLFLLPVGTLNETHEPDTFFGVERNPIEKEIIPTTWWEGGAGLSQVLDNGFSWDVAVHSGLDVPAMGSDAFRIRSGREKVSEAPAKEAAVTGRVRWSGTPGVDLSAFAQYQPDITQTTSPEDNSATLVGATAHLQRGGFGLRALAAQWSIDGAMPRALGVDDQYGYYVEPSYTVMLGNGSRVGVFGRYNYYHYAKGEVMQYDAGINFWPIDQVVLKADWSHLEEKGKEAEDIFNLGVGYSF
ncbi:MAG: porin [Akkermansiaceae bacterium]|nr:porin [Akkermansiaceae bacterium]